MVWFYLGSGHGKGVHDKARAMLKQEIHKKQLTMDSERLWCVTNMVTFYEWKKHEQHVTYPNVQ